MQTARLTAILVFALFATAAGSHTAWAKLRVVTTFTVIADMARNVAGDAATVESITKPGAEIHYYQPTPRDVQKAYRADLILWNGLNLELWFEKFFQNLKDVRKSWYRKAWSPSASPRAPIPASRIPMPGCRRRTR